MDTTINYFKSIWEHTGFQKYFRNTGWLLTARIISFLTSFLTVAIVARYLGPDNLGKLEYAQSFVAILSVIASLGIDQILYRDLIKSPDKENELIGTAVYAKLFFGLIAFLLSILISFLLGNELILTIIVGIFSSIFLINPLGTVGILFNATVKSKYGSIISIFLSFFIPFLKILIVLLNKGIIYFAVIILIETIIAISWSLYIYTFCFKGKPSLWKFRLDIFKQLMKDSWPLLLAGFSGYIYAKIDQVLLLHYIDSSTVGIYGVAVKITQIWAFLPGLIIGSMFPAIINAKKIDFNLYSKRFRSLFFFTVGVTIAIALPLYIFAPIVVNIIFGQEFIEAYPILRIYLWTSIAITLVVLAQHYLIAENFNKIFLYSSIIGATTNLVLNIILIPNFASKGSAIGTLISYMSVVISLFFFKQTRESIIKIFLAK